MKGVTFLNADGPVGLRHSELFALGKDLYDRHREVGMVYSAQVDFLVQRNADQPPCDWRRELSMTGARTGSSIRSVDTSYRGGVTVHLNEFSHRLMQDGRKRTTYLLINRSRRQALADGVLGGLPVGSPFAVLLLPHAEGQAVEAQFQSASYGPPIDPDWYDEAELIRVESRDLGWFSKSIRLENLVMERIARSSPEVPPPGGDG